METRYEKIPAREWAERYGLTVSSVIQRIRTGIYDGMKDGETWYVLLQVPPDAQGENVGNFQKLSPGFEYKAPPPKQLPWVTMPGPFRWVSIVCFIGLIFLLIPFVFSNIEHDLLLLGVTIISVASSILYEGLRTGAIRNNFGFRPTYADNSIQYVVLVISYFMFILIGSLLLCMSVFE